MSVEREKPALRQQDDDVSGWRTLLGALVVLAISAVMVVWAVATTDVRLAALRPTRDFPEERLGPRAPVSGVNEAIFDENPGLGQILNARQRGALDAYRWIDRERRLVALPIEEAMDRIAQESVP